jgi:hypothetical protein
MTESPCGTIRDFLPEWASDRLELPEARQVEEHLAACDECREEADVVRTLAQARPEPPPGLESRIRDRVREEFDGGVLRLDSRRRRIPLWGLSAAALLVLGLGTKTLLDRNGQELVLDPIAVANQEPLPEAWLWDDGVVAGGLVFDGLTEEDLEALLEEFEG